MEKKLLYHRGPYAVCAVITCAAALFSTPELRTGVPLAVFLAAVSAALLRAAPAPLPKGRLWRGLWIALSVFTAVYLVHRAPLRLWELGFGGGRAGTVLRALELIGMLPALYYFLCTFAFLAARSGGEAAALSPEEGSALSHKERLFLLFTAAAVITVCSKSSPLYPFNDWVDANCFFTVGKSLLHGQVLYRDIYEQKGILLYALHALASLISPRSFLGVWLLEIAAGYGFLLFAYKTARLFASRRCLLLMPLLAGLLYSMRSFCHGDSAEELCLPLLMYAFYVGARSIRTGTELRRRDWFFVGLTSGCALWIKFSLLGFYLGWALVPLLDMLRRRRWRSLGRMLLFLALGAAAVTLPVLAWFAAHGAVGEMFTAYFYNNIFHYGQRGSILSRLRRNAADGYLYSTLLYLSILFGTVYLTGRRDLRLGAQFLLSLGFLTVSTLNGSHAMLYYTFALGVFSVYLLPLCDALLPDVPPRRQWLTGAASALLAALLIFFNCSNLYLLSYRRQDMPQFQFAEILSRYQDPTLLNYGFLDGGFYTAAGIVPNCKYFCQLNLQLEDMYIQEEAYLREGCTDFVVTRNQALDVPAYRCIAQARFPFEGYDFLYRLYIRQDLLP